MAIARTQAVSATANTVAISSTADEDIIVVFAYAAGSTTIPTLPAGFTSLASQSGPGQATNLGYKISAGGDTSSGVWTNATQVVCMVFSGASGFATTPVLSSGTTAVLPYQPVALTVNNGTSIIIAFAGAASATAGMGGNPTGGTVALTNRTNQVKANGLDSSTTASNFAQQTLAVTGSGRVTTTTMELLAAVAVVDLPSLVQQPLQSGFSR